MHHHVRDAGGRLVRRQGEGAAGIHDGELGAGDVVGIADLDVAVLVGDDARFAHLAAGGRDGQHARDGQADLGLGLAGVEVPDFAVVRHAIGDGLGGVDHAAAADGQQEIDALLAAEGDALVHLGQARIGDDAAQLEDFQPAFAEQVADLVQEAGLGGALATEVDQDLVAAVFLDQSGDLFFGMLSEHDLRRSVVVKISHGSFG